MENKKHRYSPAVRKQQVLDAALKCARDKHFKAVTRNDVAKEGNVSPSLVAHYLGLSEDMHEKIMQHAIEKRDPLVLAQGLSLGYDVAIQAPDDLKKLAAATIAAT